MAMQPLSLFPGQVDFPSSNPAQWAVSNGRTVLAFDASTQEYVICKPGFFPQAYAGGTLTLYVFGWMASATSGGIAVQAEIEANTPNNSETATTDSFDTSNVGTVANVPGTAGFTFTCSITLTNKDSVAVGDGVRVKISRAVGNAADTATGDLYIEAAEIRES